jgi:hypothetical protein
MPLTYPATAVLKFRTSLCISNGRPTTPTISAITARTVPSGKAIGVSFKLANALAASEDDMPRIKAKCREQSHQRNAAKLKPTKNTSVAMRDLLSGNDRNPATSVSSPVVLSAKNTTKIDKP